MLITDKVRHIVGELNQSGIDPSSPSANLEGSFSSLIEELRKNASAEGTQERYRRYRTASTDIGSYPLDADGYAQSFDPLTNEGEFWRCWEQFGVVVSRDIAESTLCESTIRRLHDITDQLSGGACNLSDPSTYAHIPVDKDGTPLLTRGFFEIYHDDALAQIRQLVRMYIHHVVLLGKTDLWTSFDRFGVKLPHHEESKALPLHVDQNPLIDAEFKTLQGVLALTDCPIERGTFVAVPGSQGRFHQYDRMASRGEYVELDTSHPIAQSFQDHAQPLPLRAGSLVTWDSRTTHSNSANISDDARYVTYVAAGPVPHPEEEAMIPRAQALETGLGKNVRTSLMHASKRPRYTDPDAINEIRKPENFSLLGKLLYGLQSYKRM